MILKSAAMLFLLIALAACKAKNSDDVLAVDSSITKDDLSFAPTPGRTGDAGASRLIERVSAMGQGRSATTTRDSRKETASPRSCSAYQSLVANVSLGKELFLASDCSPIGRIAAVQDEYRFPDGTTRPAILISFKDGSADWVPRKTAQLIYVTR